MVPEESLREGRNTVQVFEVGAGTGGTSTFVLDVLAKHEARIRYRYTDIGAAFLQMARSQFGDRPYLEFDTYDIERSPEEQGFEPESMEVVLASNVLHTTRRIAETIANCRRLLKPGGIIVINELTQRLDYNTLTFGLTSGWWLYDEGDPRIPGSPLLSAEQWRRSLSGASFRDVEILGIPGATEQAQCLIVATAVPADT
jgi:SAM-dependent methyltransferase